MRAVHSRFDQRDRSDGSARGVGNLQGDLMLMRVVWDRIRNRDKSGVDECSDLESRVRKTNKAQADSCAVTGRVWRSAIYIGPGGPLMRDR